ncbi:hypothetical protein C0584_01265 [Candidatus Parcubacteria bacterium]|nr:MAG: hypothetical protein C0584_01265 [Candidatus Parcubacteria bacterium]
MYSKEEISLHIANFVISVFRTFFINIYMMIYFMPIIAVIIFIQEGISTNLAVGILHTLFLGQDLVDESDLPKIFSIYLLVFSIILNILGKVRKKKIRFTLKQKNKFLLIYLSVFYSLFLVVAIIYNFPFFILVPMYLASLFFGAIATTFDHILSSMEPKKPTNTQV